MFDAEMLRHLFWCWWCFRSWDGGVKSLEVWGAPPSTKLLKIMPLIRIFLWCFFRLSLAWWSAMFCHRGSNKQLIWLPDTSQERNCKLKAGCFFLLLIYWQWESWQKSFFKSLSTVQYFNAHRPIAMSSLVISSCFFDFCANLCGFELFWKSEL